MAGTLVTWGRSDQNTNAHRLEEDVNTDGGLGGLKTLAEELTVAVDNSKRPRVRSGPEEPSEPLSSQEQTSSCFLKTDGRHSFLKRNLLLVYSSQHHMNQLAEQWRLKRTNHNSERSSAVESGREVYEEFAERPTLLLS